LHNPMVYMWPRTSPHNKYSELLTGSIERGGLKVVHYDRSAVFKPRRGDIVHMHWPHNSYRSRLLPLTLVKSLLFAALLLFFRARGVRLFWTVHNVWPHTGKTRWDFVMRKIILLACHRAFVLSEQTKQEVSEAFGGGRQAEKLVLTPHGHYVDAYPHCDLNIREKFGIPADRFVFMFIGRIHAYKGVDRLIRAFRALQAPRAVLLIAGEVDAAYRQVFANEVDAAYRKMFASGLDPGHGGEDAGVDAGAGANGGNVDDGDRDSGGDIKVYPHFIEDGELADYLRAADVVVLPYRQITTSGSAVLALSYKKPVVAPNLGGLGEYVADECGVLYDPDDPDGLRQALLASMALDPQITEQRIAAKLKEWDWGRIAAKMVRAYVGTNEAAEVNG